MLDRFVSCRPVMANCKPAQRVEPVFRHGTVGFILSDVFAVGLFFEKNDKQVVINNN